ncbi:MAG TPA: DUF2267 domain-containing protein [Myxococcaceae bacterium]|nr:DUF2267 domain-containing protein [Myxococcaceae bacterium]
MDERTRAERSEQRRNQTFAAFMTYLRRVGAISEELAEQSAVAVLCALERRIQPAEARDLEAQLPAKLRDLVARCDRHAGLRPRAIDRTEFVGMVADELAVPPHRAEHLILAVFHALRAQVSEGEARQVEAQLPADLKVLWSRSLTTHA